METPFKNTEEIIEKTSLYQSVFLNTPYKGNLYLLYGWKIASN